MTETWPAPWSDAVLPLVTLAQVATGPLSAAQVVRGVASSNVVVGPQGQILGILSALEGSGLLTQCARDNQRVVVITDAGRAQLETWRTRWAQFTNLVDRTFDG